MASVNVVLRPRENQDGKKPLQIRITKDRKSIRINLGHSIFEKDWNIKSKTVKKSNQNSDRLNNLILKKVSEINNLILILETNQDDFTLEMLREKLVKKRDKASVFEKCDEYFDLILRAGKFNRYSGERASVNHFKRFRNQKDLAFEDLSQRMLEKFKAYLLGFVKVSERSAVNYLITIRSIYNRAISDGIVEQVHYPFGRGKMTLKRPDSEKIGLLKDEVIILENLEYNKGDFKRHALNVWLLSFYFAGMRAGDLLSLTWDKIKGERLYYTMAKNLKSDSIKVSDKAFDILEEYENQELAHNLILPDLSNVLDVKNKIEVQKKLKYRIRKINNSLEEIRKETKLNKDLTMHIARHSFATIAGDKIPIQRLKTLYRHSSISTTINYQNHFIQSDVDDALDKVLDF